MHGRVGWSARGALAGLIATVALALAAPGASAEWAGFKGWDLYSDRRPAVAIDAAGNATAVWESGIYVLRERQIYTASRPAGGDWSEPQPLAPDLSADQLYPRLVVGPDGTLTAAWIQGREVHGSGREATVQVSSKPAGGSWQAPAALTPSTLSIWDLDLAVDADGDALLAWAASDETSGALRTSQRPAGGTWQTPQVVRDLGVRDIDVAVRDGAAAVVWTEQTRVWGAYRPDDGAWDDPEQLSAVAQKPAVTLDGGGTAIAVFNALVGTSDNAVKWTQRPAAAGHWSEEELLGQGVDPAIASNAGGDVVASWSGHIFVPGGVDKDLQVAFRDGGGWGPTLTHDGGSSDTLRRKLVLDDRGALTVAVGASIYHREPNGTWSQMTSFPQELLSSIVWNEAIADPNHEPGSALAVNGAGDVVTGFRRYGASVYLDAMLLLGADFRGPRLDALSVPATATAGEPVGVSVDALDVWSGVEGGLWDFGDGATADTASASHTYATPGTYAVKLSVSDRHGHTTTATREIVVSEAAAREPEGREPEGREPEGREPEGREPEGREPEGREPEGREPEGREPEGREPEGSGRGGEDPGAGGGGPAGGGSAGGGGLAGGGSTTPPAGPPAPTGGTADTTAPGVTRIGLTTRKVTLRLSEAAQVRVTVRRCTVKRTRRGGRRAVCAKAVAVAGQLPAGNGALSVPRGTLAKGRYRVTVTATDAAGNEARVGARPRVR